jgi:hypothetical protein
MCASPVAYSNLVFCTAFGKGSAVVRVTCTNNTWTTNQLWLRGRPPAPATSYQSMWMTPVIYQGYLYGQFGTTTYVASPLNCIELETGNLMWSTNNFGMGGTILVNNYLLTLTEDGQLVLSVPNPSAYTELARFRAFQFTADSPGKCWNSPAYSNGRIYARSTTGGICVDVSVPPQGPQITTPPLSKTVYTNVDVTFTVIVIGATPFSYQWLTGGTNLINGGGISGSTNAALTISQVSATDVASYSVVVTNQYGSVTSSVANLTVLAWSGEASQRAVLNNNPVAFYECNEVINPAISNVIAFDYVGGYNGIYGVGAQNAASGPLPPDWPGFSANNTAVRIYSGQPDSQVTVPAFKFETNTVSITAWINPNEGQTAFAGLVVCRTNSTAAGLGYTANQDANGNYTLGYTWEGDLWDSGLVAPPHQWSFVALTVSATNAVIYVINTNCLLSSSHVFAHLNQAFDGPTLIGDDSADGGNGSLEFSGTIDDVALFSSTLTRSQVLGLYTTASGNTPPNIAITSQPKPVTVDAWYNASFGVTAIGTMPLNYQWSFNGSNISNASASSLTISNVTQDNLGAYAVVVSNAFGTVASSNATLSMYPFIESPFTGAVTYWGKDATLSVQAWGTGPLSYQWFYNGVAILNGTNQNLELSSIQFTNAGLYSVVVSSPLGSSVTNTPAQVVVNPAGVSLGMYAGVTVSGVVGYTYCIQATSDLTKTNSWATVASLTLMQPIQLWVDISVNASTNPHRFYRVIPGE